MLVIIRVSVAEDVNLTNDVLDVSNVETTPTTIVNYSNSYPRYQVEIIVFSNLQSQPAIFTNQESFLANTGEINKNGSSEFNATNTQVKFLLNEYNKLKKKSNYKIILHAATQYNLLPSQKNKKFLITSESKFSENESKNNGDFNGILTITPVRNTFNLAFDGIFSKFRLTKSAKIKNKEIYYFDHPMFGALVTMVEIKDK